MPIRNEGLTQGIPYLYFKLAKCHVFLIIFYHFSSTKSENKRVEHSAWRQGVEIGVVAWGG
jgi:hypothetical protein